MDAEFKKMMEEAVISGIKGIKNPRVIMLGSNMYIGTDGLIKYYDGKSYKDFFKVREISNSRNFDSHLAIDVDIKDQTGKREVKLAKSKPVASSLEGLQVESEKKFTKVYNADGSLIICVEQIETTDTSLPKDGPVRMAIESGLVDSILRITGSFTIGNSLVKMTNEDLITGNGSKLSGNLKANGDFLTFHPDGGLSF